MSQATGNLRGAAAMTISMAGFALNDAIMKIMSFELAMFQAIFIRGILASFLMAGLAWSMGSFKVARYERSDNGPIAARILGEIGGTICFLTAVFNMPIANATAILQALPLAVTIAAMLFLGESFGWRRGVAICIGLVGVLMIIQPGSDGFTVYSIWSLAAVGFIVLRDLATRSVSNSIPSPILTLITALGITVFAGISSSFTAWNPVSFYHFGMLSAAAILLLIGYYFGVSAMRVGEVSFIAPFRYSVMIWALICGYVLFGDIPDSLTLLGCAIVISMGLYTLYREQVRKRLVAAPVGQSATR